MKILKLILLAFLLEISKCYCQENANSNYKPFTSNISVKKISYNFTFEVSPLIAGMQYDLTEYSEDRKKAHLDIMRFGLYQSHNILLKDKWLTGLGYGAEVSLLRQELDFPLYFNFSYYFNLPNHDVFTPFVNLNIGAIINTTYCNDKIQLESPGFFSTFMGGFKMHKFQFSGGLYFRTEKNMRYERGNYLPIFYPLRKSIGIDLAFRIGIIL